jgi:preprotein translocase subunit Sss1
MFEIFTVVFAILILAGSVLLLRRRSSLDEQSTASLGVALGFGLGGAAGLVLSRVAGTFVYILPVSLGIGMAFGGGVGWLIDSLMQKD